MIKVRIENPTGHQFSARFPGAMVEIPPNAVGGDAVSVDLPELPSVENWLNSLCTRHRAISWSLVEGELECGLPDDTHEDDEQGGDVDVDASDPDSTGLENGDTYDDDTPGDDPFDLFKASVRDISKGGGGWWTVEVDGSDPIKVRGCDTEGEAILEAYKEQVEG